MTARTAALALLALALMLGAGLRFYRLKTADLSADEAASWAGAAAPDLRTVVALERKLDPGKLALYDAALHVWMGLWGDSAGSMRALSAVLGTIAIALVFLATLELGSGLCGLAEIHNAEFGAAAFAALLTAVNPVLIGQARTVRMYPLLLVLELLQVICLLRAVSGRTRRAGRIGSLVGVTAFSALAIACNFTGALLVAAEAMWLAWTALCRRVGRGSRAAAELRLLLPSLALCAGVALLGPSAPMAGRTSIAVVHAGILGWSHLRPPWWPLEMLRDATGKAPFLPLLPLAIYGGWRLQRDNSALALGFLLWWMLAPVAAVMAISYAFTPFEETRYVISSVAAFLTLAAIGLAAIDWARLRIGLLILVIALSLDHVRRDFIKPEYVQWREATALALAASPPGGAFAVIPGYAVNAVRYYLPPKLRASVESAEDRCDPHPHVLLLGRDDLLAPAQLAALRDCDPVVVGRFKLVEVRRR